jgi:hypothetical protein
MNKKQDDSIETNTTQQYLKFKSGLPNEIRHDKCSTIEHKFENITSTKFQTKERSINNKTNLYTSNSSNHNRSKPESIQTNIMQKGNTSDPNTPYRTNTIDYSYKPPNYNEIYYPPADQEMQSVTTTKQSNINDNVLLSQIHHFL